jgi:hypothetical protein
MIRRYKAMQKPSMVAGRAVALFLAVAVTWSQRLDSRFSKTCRERPTRRPIENRCCVGHVPLLYVFARRVLAR